MNSLKITILAGIIFNIFLLGEMAGAGFGDFEVNFLDVGQGDSTLLISDGVKIITDAGPNKKVSESLGSALGKEKYIDLAIITHPELDHYNGFNFLLDEYKFGAFIINGRNSDTREWKDLLEKIKTSKTPLIVLGEGDEISFGKTKIDILSPGTEELQSGATNDTSIVQEISKNEIELLLTGDIGFYVENRLMEKYGKNLDIDILKVAHHGSKYSSGKKFLEISSPAVALVGLGEGNRYGHPSKEAITGIEKVGSKIYRTDKNGSILISIKDDFMNIFANNPSK